MLPGILSSIITTEKPRRENAGGKSNKMRKDLRDIRDKLQDIAESEATYLFRLAWRMKAHGCDPKNIEECRNEARRLHMTAYPERLVSLLGEYEWKYAFKI